MTDKTVIILIDASSFYGRTVIDRLADTNWFYDEHDVRAVTDNTTGKAVNILNAHDVPAIAVENAGTPTEAIKAGIDDTFSYLITCSWSHKVPPDTIDLPSRRQSIVIRRICRLQRTNSSSCRVDTHGEIRRRFGSPPH